MRLRGVLAICGAAAALLSAGCGNSGSSGSTAADGSAAAGGPITLAIGVDPVFTPVFVADAEGMFKKAGLDVEVRQFANAGEAADALVAGAVDVAGVPDYNLLTRAPRAPLASLGIFAQDPGDYVQVVSAKDVSSPADMKKIGIVPGTYSEYGAAKLLEHFHVDPSTVKMVPAGPPELPALLQKGDVDGYVIWPPWTTRGVDMGGKILMPTGAYGLGTVLTISTSDAWLQAHQDEAKTLMRVLQQAAQETEADPAKAGQAGADEAKLPADLTESAVKQLDFGVRAFTAKDRSNFAQIGEYLVKRGILKSPPSLDDLLVDGYVPDQSGG